MTRTEETLSTRDIASPAGRGRDAARRNGGATQATTEPTSPSATERRTSPTTSPLLPESQGAELQSRWEAIQTRFVDDPRSAVEEADALVASTMQQLADGFASAREDLEGQWSRGEDISTEDLRVALQRYRSFFRRLLLRLGLLPVDPLVDAPRRLPRRQRVDHRLRARLDDA